MLKRMLKELLMSKLGNKGHSRHSSSDSYKRQGGYPPSNQGNYHHNNQGHTYYRRKHKSHSSS
ncbi:MAG: hypothetical protein K0R28_1400 [Paenibacillus sp.]|jgi:hypothetical protein|nr:hypothetical protein [Paenibacillus sp.]